MFSIITPRFITLVFLFSCLFTVAQQAESVFTNNIFALDGESNEADWSLATWYAIDQVVLGSNLSPTDFSGRFKSIWDQNFIYLLVEVTDDSLSDDHVNPTDNYWNDDCVEIFIDENKTGEVHQYNHKAFAYHVSILGEVVDVGLNQSPILLPGHVKSILKKTGAHTYNWEMKIAVYNDGFNENNASNTPVKLTLNKQLGFTVGYCDNDETTVREHFILSNPGQGDTGWINSSGFGSLTLVSNPVNGVQENIYQQASISPLPFSDSFKLNLTVDAMVTIYNSAGIILFAKNFERGIHTIENLQKKGMYYLQVVSLEGIQTIKVIKE